MNLNIRAKICHREILWGDRFLTKYENELRRLRLNAEFMKLMYEIAFSKPEDVVFSANPQNGEFKLFKRELSAGIFQKRSFFLKFNAFATIEADVSSHGSAKSSAYISVFYAIMYLEARDGNDVYSHPLPNKQSEKTPEMRAYEKGVIVGAMIVIMIIVGFIILIAHIVK